ncbi:MAG: c-type cytochrome domain-containing protein [Elusimicrobiota bacterium]
MNHPAPVRRTAAALLACAALLVQAFPAGAAEAGKPNDKKIDFAADVQPILKASCVKCHGLDPEKPKKKPAAGLRLDDKSLAMKGGKTGRDIIPGDSKNSMLFKLLSGPVTLEDGKDLDPMPKVKKGQKWKPLSAAQVETLRLWIDQGADWPATK